MGFLNSTLVFSLVALALAGSPALHAASICPTGNTLSTPTADFTDHGNGTVTHAKTGLMWKQCVQGLSGAGCATGTYTTLTWSAALAAAMADTTGGYNDWRLPNQKELRSIVESGCHSPSINETAFPTTPGNYYWSSNTYADNPALAWSTVFSDGSSHTEIKSINYYVRLVRGGQPLDPFDAQADGVPDAFSLTPVTGAAVSTVTTSNTVTLSGLTQTTGISIACPAGDAACGYSVNGGAYTSAAGTVANGDTVTVTVTSSASTLTLVTATLAVGGVTGAFNVTTASNNANLSNLALSSGTLNPAFASGTLSYSAWADLAVPSVTVTPTVADATATVTVNGTPVASGSASGAISLSPGANPVAVAVTAQDGVTVKTYSVTVNQADLVPNAFTFTDQGNVTPGSTVASNVISVTGITGPAPVSIALCGTDVCEYAVNGGTWTAAPGFVNNGDTVQVRQHASASPLTETRLHLDIGGVSDAFSVTTAASASAGVLQFEVADYTVAEGVASVTLKVTRSGGATGAASVHYATANGSATAGSDYTAKSGTLSWLAGDAAAKTLTVTITSDAVVEPNETFTVTLDSPVGASLGTPNPATVTILDRGSTVQFNPAAVSVSEAAGNAILTVSRGGSTLGAVNVSYATANGTALAGSDYLATSGTLTWADGEGGDKTISVPLINDTVTESAETFTVTLSNAVGAILGSAKTATVTLTDDDSALQFSMASTSVSEGVASGVVTLSVTRTGTASGAASATWSTADGTAVAGSDYTASSGTLNWAAGDASAKTLTVTILNDTVVEGSETFKVNLTSAVGATLGTNKTITVTITDNDTGAGVLQFSAPSYTVRENGTSLTLGVTRSSGTTGIVTVQYATSNGSATAGQDYAARSGTLSWASSDGATKSISIPITNDALAEGTETFVVTLANPTGGATLGTNNPATVSIIDDETAAAGGIQFQNAKYTVAENAGSVTLTVTRGGDTSNAAQVSFASVNGTATSGTDYVAQSGTLSWSAGDSSSKTIIVPIVNNTTAEATEAFSMTLSNASGSTLGANSSTTVTILDEDELFPPGAQMPLAWVKPLAADQGWFVSWSQFQAGVASLRSGNVQDGQKAQMEFTESFQNGMVSFALKVSSEANADFLRFYIDGVKKGEWSGLQTMWTTANYPLTAGIHTLTWSYEKDGSLMAGTDTAWVDTVSLPALQ